MWQTLLQAPWPRKIEKSLWGNILVVKTDNKQVNEIPIKSMPVNDKWWEAPTKEMGNLTLRQRQFVCIFGWHGKCHLLWEARELQKWCCWLDLSQLLQGPGRGLSYVVFGIFLKTHSTQLYTSGYNIALDPIKPRFTLGSLKYKGPEVGMSLVYSKTPKKGRKLKKREINSQHSMWCYIHSFNINFFTAGQKADKVPVLMEYLV